MLFNREKVEPPQPPENAEQPAEQQAEEKVEPEVKNDAVQEQEEPDMWEETFKSHTDSKPNGKLVFKNW